MTFWYNNPDYGYDDEGYPIENDETIQIPDSVQEFIKNSKPNYIDLLPVKPEDWADLAHFFGVNDLSLDDIVLDFRVVEKDAAIFLQRWLEDKGDRYAVEALSIFIHRSMLADFRKGKLSSNPDYNDDLNAAKYLEFRKKFPGHDRSLFADSRNHVETLEHVSQELVGHGIDSELISDALEINAFGKIPWGIDRACDKLSLALLENAIKRESLISAGESHLVGRKKAIPESIINETSLLILERCQEDKIPPPTSLIVLLRMQLERLSPLNILKSDDRAFDLAALMLASNEDYTNRKIGQAVGVDQSTIGRWKKDVDFMKRVNEFNQISNIETLIQKLTEQ